MTTTCEQQLCNCAARYGRPWHKKTCPGRPVPGVVAGSELERQIQLARAEIDKWPASVKAAMRIDQSW
jgi:hypothetical protein